MRRRVISTKVCMNCLTDQVWFRMWFNVLEEKEGVDTMLVRLGFSLVVMIM